jgi:hypothetical protein
MKLLFTGLFCCFHVVLAQPDRKSEVLLLGTFHFDNPGLDVAQFENANILSAKRQQEELEVVKRLNEWRPDKIFVEADPKGQTKLDSSLDEFKEGSFILKAGEIHQLGFRVARDLDLPSLYGVDYRESQFPFDSLVKVATETKQFRFLDWINRSIDSIQKSFNAGLKTHTVQELLLAQNAETARRFEVGAYFDFLPVGPVDNHVGSYLTAEWWRRNMVIYENILKRLDGKEKRILIIFGSAHTSLLREMMRYNDKLEIVDVSRVLSK